MKMRTTTISRTPWRMLATTVLSAAFAFGLLGGCAGEEPPSSDVDADELRGTAIDGSEDAANDEAEDTDEPASSETAEQDTDASETASAEEPAADAPPSEEQEASADGPPAGYERELAAAGASDEELDELLEIEANRAEEIRAEARREAEQRLEEAGEDAPETDAESRREIATSQLDQMHKLGGKPLDAPESVDGYISVSFPDLGGFEFTDDPPEDAAEHGRNGELTDPDPSQLPDAIRELNGEKIAISGYMIPNNFRDGGTSEFTLVPVVPSCFFCVTPAPMDWIEVTTADGEYVPYVGDKPITVSGTLDAGAVYSGVFLQSLYRMEADEVVELEED